MVLFCVCRIHPPHVIVIQFHPSVCCRSDWEGERPSGGWEVVASLGYLIGSQTVKMVHPHARLLLLILPLLLVSMCRYVWRNLGSSVSSISCLVPPSFCLSLSLLVEDLRSVASVVTLHCTKSQFLHDVRNRQLTFLKNYLARSCPSNILHTHSFSFTLSASNKQTHIKLLNRKSPFKNGWKCSPAIFRCWRGQRFRARRFSQKFNL